MRNRISAIVVVTLSCCAAAVAAAGLLAVAGALGAPDPDDAGVDVISGAYEPTADLADDLADETVAPSGSICDDLDLAAAEEGACFVDPAVQAARDFAAAAPIIGLPVLCCDPQRCGDGGSDPGEADEAACAAGDTSACRLVGERFTLRQFDPERAARAYRAGCAADDLESCAILSLLVTGYPEADTGDAPIALALADACIDGNAPACVPFAI